jgi:hypothetical protein
LTWAAAATEVVVDEEEDDVEFEAEDGGGSLEELVVEVLLVAKATVQACTSITTGLPSSSTLGVRVIVHVWVIGPTTLKDIVSEKQVNLSRTYVCEVWVV